MVNATSQQNKDGVDDGEVFVVGDQIKVINEEIQQRWNFILWNKIMEIKLWNQ